MDPITIRGIPIEQLSREELLEALTWAVRTLQQEREWSRQNAEMETLFSDTRRRLRYPLFTNNWPPK